VAGAGRSSTPVTWQPRPVRFGVQDARGGMGGVTHPGCAQQALIVLVSVLGWVQWGWGLTWALTPGFLVGVRVPDSSSLRPFSSWPFGRVLGGSSLSTAAVGGCWDPGRRRRGFWGPSASVTWRWAGVGVWVVVVGVS